MSTLGLAKGAARNSRLTERWGTPVVVTVCVTPRELANELSTDGESEHGSPGSRQFCSTADIGVYRRGT